MLEIESVNSGEKDNKLDLKKLYNTHVIELLPGKYRIWVEYSCASFERSFGTLYIYLKGEAGHAYVIYPEFQFEKDFRGIDRKLYRPELIDVTSVSSDIKCRI